MSDLVQQRWPDGLRERVDEVAGKRGRTEFTVRALERALGNEPAVNYGALGEGLAPGPSEVVERLERAQERSQKPNRFGCGCATSATSHKARCPRHNRALI